MACACQCHCHIVLVAKVNAFLVAEGAAWLYNGGDTCGVRYFNAVGEREESIARHNCAREVKAEVFGFGDGLR